MPVPTLITDLSTTAASNYPAGSDSPSTLDDVQRAHASFVATIRDTVGLGTGTLVPATARTNFGAAEIGANSTITSLSAVASINSGYLYGNRIINGAMEIDQVNSGAAVTPLAATTYLTDMFGCVLSQNSKLTFQQVTDAPAGLLKSMKITVAAQYAPVATDVFIFRTAIEGKDVIDFQFGTAGAVTITTSQWIKGSIAGTYAVSVKNFSGARSYVGTVTVTTSWSPLKVTLTGDTTGTWNTDNTVGMFIDWDLGSGSNYNTTAGVWTAGNFSRTSGSVTFVNQVAGSTLNITGVDCRLGSVAPTVFERRANELQLAQRYYALMLTGSLQGGSYALAGNSFSWTFKLPVSMRAVPTATSFGFSNVNLSAQTLTAAGTDFLVVNNTVTATGAYAFSNNATATASARLF